MPKNQNHALPSHLRQGAAGRRILQAVKDIGVTPKPSLIGQIWPPNYEVSERPAKVRKALRKAYGLDIQDQTPQGESFVSASRVRSMLGLAKDQFRLLWDSGKIHPAEGVDPGPDPIRRNKKIFHLDDVARWRTLVPAWEKDFRDEEQKRGRALAERRRELRDQFQIPRPAEAYPLARSLNRRIVFHSGPTNSGKTHAAMLRLTDSSSGLYAAPLRLLAMEGYDRLLDSNLLAAMKTGEEMLGRDDATHLACTVEAMPTDSFFDVAVIDEIQMLADPDRGWAWTRALLAAPSPEVHLAGSPDALPLIQAILQQTGETVEVRSYERRSELLMLDVPARTLEAGDAVIGFSRRQVMGLRARFLSKGYTVATIFGALPPEVRRKEASRFSSGEAQILVATDAIGMGLNLPIRRIIFSEVVKFDGFERRLLTPSEFRQIAGRAGRGDGEPGYVGTLPGLSDDYIRNALAQRPLILDDSDEESDNFGVVHYRPQVDAYPPQRGKWSERIKDLRSLRTDLPAGWHLDIGPAFDKAAQIADTHENASEETGSFCLTAPIDEDSEAPSTRALQIGLAELRSAGKWPTPLLPSKMPRTDADIGKWAVHGAELTMARWFSRRDSGERIDADKIEDAWRRYIAGLAGALSSEDLFPRTCPECGSELTWHHRHRLCDDCFFGSGDF